MSASTPPLTLGRTVATAQQVLTSLLAQSLAAADTHPLAWLALDRLATEGPYADVDALVRAVEPATRTYPGSAREVVDGLVAGGLVAAPDGAPELTAAGEARYRELREMTSAVTRRVLAPFDPEEVEAAARTLQAVAEHARTLQGSA